MENGGGTTTGAQEVIQRVLKLVFDISNKFTYF
jgi:hypothetical protein